MKRIDLPSSGPVGPESKQPQPRRLGLLVIGDEILAGHTQDINTIWLGKKCKSLGIELRRVEICTDDLPDIEASMRRFLHDLDLDYVVTSGGIGPTHDDRTMEALAAATDAELVLEPEWLEWMRDRVRIGHDKGWFNSATPNSGHRKMAHLPRGAEAMPNHRGTALGAIVRVDGTALFTLPGVPSEFQLMFEESVEPMLQTGPRPHVEELTLYTEESRFYDKMVELDAEYPTVALGSYPHWGYILLRATGPEADARALIAEMREAGRDYLEPRSRPENQ